MKIEIVIPAKAGNQLNDAGKMGPGFRRDDDCVGEVSKMCRTAALTTPQSPTQARHTVRVAVFHHRFVEDLLLHVATGQLRRRFAT